MNGSNSVPRPQAASPPLPDDRLDSWKEIAAYLRRDESTVRRWEKDGLPVHRHRHRFRAAVFAYKPELDTWLNNSRDNAEQCAATEMVRDGLDQPSQRAQVSAQPPALAAPRPAPARLRTWGLALSVLVVLGLGSYWGWRRFARNPLPSENIKLAVLPLTNLSGSADQEYFSDGLTEEMITELSRLQPDRLAVIARTTTMQYKGTTKRIDEIGRDLHVDYVLEGSVRRDGSQVRISVQLIRVSDQTHVWAETYQREMGQVLAVQSQIAAAVARETSLTLMPAERARLDSRPIVNPEVYQLYLRGRFHWNQRTEQGLRKGLEYFEQAIERDPDYAPAYTGLADSYSMMVSYFMVSPQEAFPKAKLAARKAIELDDSLAEAHASLAFALHRFDWSWAAAESEFQRAIALNPSYPPAHQWYAELLVTSGRHEQAIAEVRRARELDPLSLVINSNVGRMLYFARRYDDAIRELQSTLELDPDYPWAHIYLSMAYTEKQMYSEAFSAMQRARKTFGPHGPSAAEAQAYARMGRGADARRILAELRRSPEVEEPNLVFIAGVQAALREKDKAFAALERAYQQRSFFLVELGVHPWLQPLRDDPRFADLARRVNLTDPAAPAGKL